MRRAIWTPLAVQELEEILFYIRVVDGRPETARQIGEEFLEEIERHLAHGRLGMAHPAAPGGWRYFKFKRWLIFYRPHPEGMEIMRVIDAVRDLPAQF